MRYRKKEINTERDREKESERMGDGAYLKHSLPRLFKSIDSERLLLGVLTNKRGVPREHKFGHGTIVAWLIRGVKRL